MSHDPIDLQIVKEISCTIFAVMIVVAVAICAMLQIKFWHIQNLASIAANRDVELAEVRNADVSDVA